MRIAKLSHFILVLAGALGAVPATAAEQRIALIVSNETYVSSDLGRLPGTLTDAQRMKTALEKDGFTVTVVRDAGLGAMRQAVGSFVLSLAQAGKDGVGFLYYTGHGIASDTGQENYLIPVDARPRGFAELALQALDMSSVVRSVTATGAKAAFIVIDACRNRPVSWMRGSKGLWRAEPSTDMLIAYATAPQATASDDGLYSRVLSEELSKEGANSITLFQTVQSRVALATSRRQIPAFESRLVDTVIFQPALPTQPFVTPTRRPTAPGAALPTDSPAIASLRQRALAGDAASQASLGYKYDFGQDGLARNQVEAARLYKLAADQGNAAAQNNLGVLYERGQGGLIENKAEAARLYKLAADQGYATAQANLGNCYSFGKGGLPVNKAEAARLRKLAADQGLANAQAALGGMYFLGAGGLPKDRAEAIRLYKLAARQGDQNAQTALKTLGESW